MITLYCGYNIPSFIPKQNVRDLRALWAAEELQIQYNVEWLDPMAGQTQSPEFKKINPFGRIPALVDGDFALFESGAIVTYLADKAQKLIPAPESKERHIYNQWAFAALNTIETPLVDLMVMRLRHSDKPWFTERTQLVLENAESVLGALNQTLPRSPFVLGSEFTVADILVAQVLNFASDELLARFPIVKSYHRTLTSRPAYKRALAKQAAGPKSESL